MKQNDWLDYFSAIHGRVPSIEEMAEAYDRGEFVKDDTRDRPGSSQTEVVKDQLVQPNPLSLNQADFAETGAEAQKTKSSSEAHLLPFAGQARWSKNQTKTNLLMVALGTVTLLVELIFTALNEGELGSDLLGWFVFLYMSLIMAIIFSAIGLIPVLINKTPQKWLLFGISIGVGIFTAGLSSLLDSLGFETYLLSLLTYVTWLVLLVFSVHLNQKQAQKRQRQMMQSASQASIDV